MGYEIKSLPLGGANRPGDDCFARTEAERRQVSAKLTDEGFYNIVKKGESNGT